MDKFNDKILYKTRQHKIVLMFNFFRVFGTFWIPVILISYFVASQSLLVWILVLLISVFLSFSWVYFFWNRSYFIVTNKKVAMDVRNGIFSQYHMNIYFKNIRDTAYSKNNFIHYLFNCGSLFARSSAWSSGDFEAYYLPEIEKVYKIVNNVYLLSEEKREVLENINSLDDLKSHNDKKYEEPKKETLEEIIEKEKKVLLSIQWIKEVVLLSDKDKVYIFENEEDRNHWVYESLRKKVLFAITHDSTFRNPDEAIVYQKWEKVIFPTVKFHEIKRNWVISSSPWMKVHEYLKQKFQNMDEYDATILVGFDLE